MGMFVDPINESGLRDTVILRVYNWSSNSVLKRFRTGVVPGWIKKQRFPPNGFGWGGIND